MRHRGRTDKGRPSPWNLLATEEPTDIRSFFCPVLEQGRASSASLPSTGLIIKSLTVQEI